MQKSSEKFEKHFEVARTFLKKNNLRKAQEFFKKALIYNSDDYRVYKELGLILYHQCKFSESIQDYLRALQLNPQDFEIYYRLGCVYYYNGQIDASIAHFERAISLNKDFAPSYYCLGLAYEIKGKIEESLEHIQKALMLSPNVKDLILIPKNLNKREDITIDAVLEGLKLGSSNFINTVLEKLLVKVPPIYSRKKDKFLFYFEAGINLIKERRFDLGILNLKKALEFNRKSFKTYQQIGLAYFYLGKMDLAEKNISSAIELEETDLYSNYYLGCIFLQTGNLDKAISIFQRIIKQDEKFAPAYYSLGIAYEKDGEIMKSFNAMEKAVSLDPNVRDLVPTIGAEREFEKEKLKSLSGKRGFFSTLFLILYLTFLHSIIYLLERIQDLIYGREKYEKFYNRIDRNKIGLKEYIKRIEAK